MSNDIFTIGHSNRTWEKFAPLLRRHGIQALVDIRSNPVSRHAPFANARTMPRLLDEIGVQYIPMGASLGGRPSDRSLYDESGRPDYEKIRAKRSFRDGIEKLLELAEESIVALMCAEEDPARCHRRLLIGPVLEERGVQPRHIRGDGTIQGALS